MAQHGKKETSSRYVDWFIGKLPGARQSKKIRDDIESGARGGLASPKKPKKPKK